MFHASNWTKSTLGVGSTKLQTGSASLPILNLNGKLLSLWYKRGFGTNTSEPMSQLNNPNDALHHPLCWRQHLVRGTVCARANIFVSKLLALQCACLQHRFQSTAFTEQWRRAAAAEPSTSLMASIASAPIASTLHCHVFTVQP